ncbi:MAG TPA: YfiR family protein [Candidatus Didemnitutus sp.]|jgi:hypothetical protein
MAFLTAVAGRVPGWRRPLWILVGLALGAAAPQSRADPAPEYQVKAVFLFNFTQFVEWPPEAFKAPDAPLVIGILGDDPFGTYLDHVVHGEKSGVHPLIVKRLRDAAEAADCQLLFLSPSAMPQFNAVLAAVAGRGILTVGDGDEFARRGGMIRFFTANNKIRLRINLGAARAAGLTISSKLLRPAEIVPTES